MERNILIAFILNLSFAIFEFFGGIFTGSVAIISDAVHDLGDAASIGVSYFFERKSRKQSDDKYTFGYLRYSVIGSLITVTILLIGSVMVIYNAINRIVVPETINYNGMLIFAIVGVCVNLCAVFFTHKGESLNQKAVNLHMLEDVLGWIIVLIGAVIMKFTDFSLIDPIMSIGVAIFIIVSAIKNLKEVFDLFLEKTPSGVNIIEIQEKISEIDNVIDVHHIHIWSMDGQSNYATMHVVAKSNSQEIKEKIRKKLREHKIVHATLEFENEDEICNEKHCSVAEKTISTHHHHHH